MDGFSFYCPGCDHGHVFYTTAPPDRPEAPTWEFDGNMDCPTFTPSLLNTCEKHPDPKQRRCHLTLTGGKITFHADCSHDMAGQTVELRERPEP